MSNQLPDISTFPLPHRSTHQPAAPATRLLICPIYKPETHTSAARLFSVVLSSAFSRPACLPAWFWACLILTFPFSLKTCLPAGRPRPQACVFRSPVANPAHPELSCVGCPRRLLSSTIRLCFLFLCLASDKERYEQVWQKFFFELFVWKILSLQHFFFFWPPTYSKRIKSKQGRKLQNKNFSAHYKLHTNISLKIELFFYLNLVCWVADMNSFSCFLFFKFTLHISGDSLFVHLVAALGNPVA